MNQKKKGGIVHLSIFLNNNNKPRSSVEAPPPSGTFFKWFGNAGDGSEVDNKNHTLSRSIRCCVYRNANSSGRVAFNLSQRKTSKDKSYRRVNIRSNYP